MLDWLLERLVAEGLVKAGGKQRADSTHVVAAVAALNRLELAGESVRAALEALAVAHPGWLAQRVCVADFTRRYGTPMTSWRPPVPAARPGGDGLPPAHIRINSPYDLDARWGVERDTFWLGCKLHISESCDDPPACAPSPARKVLPARPGHRAARPAKTRSW